LGRKKKEGGFGGPLKGERNRPPVIFKAEREQHKRRGVLHYRRKGEGKT